MEWVYIGAYYTNALSNKAFTRKLRCQITMFENNVYKYNLDMDEIYAQGTKCYQCNKSGDKNLIFYLYNLESKKFRIFGSSCISRHAEFRRKCSICNNLYDYYKVECPDCKELKVFWNGSNRTFGSMSRKFDDNNYSEFCYAVVYGNRDCLFAKYLIDSGLVECPKVTYDYYTEGRYENCSKYHIYAIEKLGKSYREIPEIDLILIRDNMYASCFICGAEVGRKNKIHTSFDSYHVCHECEVISANICGQIIQCKYFYGDFKFVIGYFYANDDDFSAIFGRIFGIERTIVEEDVIIHRDTRIDVIMAYGYYRFKSKFLNYTREELRSMYNVVCDICKYRKDDLVDDCCICDRHLYIGFVSPEPIKFIDLFNDKPLCQICLDSNMEEIKPYENILANYGIVKKEYSLMLPASIIRDFYRCQIAIMSIIENRPNLLYEAVINNLNKLSVMNYVFSQLSKLRELFEHLLKVPGVREELIKFMKKIGTKQVMVNGKRSSISTLCCGRRREEFKKIVDSEEIRLLMDKHPALREYYSYHNPTHVFQ